MLREAAELSLNGESNNEADVEEDTEEDTEEDEHSQEDQLEHLEQLIAQDTNTSDISQGNLSNQIII